MKQHEAFFGGWNTEEKVDPTPTNPSWSCPGATTWIERESGTLQHD
jgi:hypothetical protein